MSKTKPPSDKIVLPSRETVLRVALEVSNRIIAEANKEDDLDLRTPKTARALAPNERFETCLEWQVDCAKKIVAHHKELVGRTLPISNRFAIGEMLLNLMHLCDEEGVDFNQALEDARENYELEVTK